VALVATLLVVRSFMAANHMNRPSAPGTFAEERHAARGTPMTLPPAAAPAPVTPPPPRVNPAPTAPGRDVRVAPASEQGARTVVLFRWPASSTAPITLTYGDGRSIPVPQSLARRLIEDQAGKTIEQLAEESARKHVRSKP
jgi:hypothetical protein